MSSGYFHAQIMLDLLSDVPNMSRDKTCTNSDFPYTLRCRLNKESVSEEICNECLFYESRYKE